jgi:outer membrane protein assembly factor BamD (BamD/ComL family)
MRARYPLSTILIVLLLSSSFQPLFAQLGFDLKIDKPEPYDNRTLKSEKTGNKALKGSKKFFQNLTTHYNYFYNANNRINEIIAAAKEVYRDDYTQLLSFYNYTLDATAQDSVQLDSVIYRTKTALVIHDLRNDWADNMYLLWGAAWFLEKKFDSARMMFQFINYSFAEKEPDGYYRYIGSHLDGNNALSIATDEKKKSTSEYGSRNNAFIWQARTFIESGRMTEAATLITTLKEDPFFPKRLTGQLEEIQAYWYYIRSNWDSSAVHLALALDNAQTKQERARWEYLVAQMYEKSGNLDAAKMYYSKVIGHTTDPVMDVYSRLNIVRTTKDTSNNYIDKNIEELLKMAKKDRYVDYRDVIYYMAAQMEMDRGNLAAAQDLLLKASKYNNGNIRSRSKSFLMIADLAYDQKKYIQAGAFYDSIQGNDLTKGEMDRVQERKSMLTKVIAYNATITRQDSLQRIAAMPEEERTAYLRKLYKRLLKEQGINESAVTSGYSNPLNNNSADLFASSQSKGEWYFYNPTLKSQGAAQFKQVWGNRPNTDNWRRFASVSQQLTAKVPANNPNNAANQTTDQKTTVVDNTPSIENLTKDLPLTEQQLKLSNDSVSNALFGLGTVLLNEAEDYLSAIDAYEKLRSHYPSYPNMSEVLFNLYYAYKKAGNMAKANEIRQLLLGQYPSSRFATIVTTGKDPQGGASKAEEATRTYNDIYNMFIEGRFTEAEAAKKQADSLYQTNHWEPQLLYIEAVYHIRQREDSIAKMSLQTIIGQDPRSRMAEKAQTMIDVLNRRSQIEAELSRYQIQNREDTSVKRPAIIAPIVQSILRKQDTTAVVKPNVAINNAVKNDTLTKKLLANKSNVKVDTAVKTPVVIAPPVKKDTVAQKAVVVTLPPVKNDTVAINQNTVVKPPAEKTAAIEKTVDKPVTTTTKPVVVAPLVVNTPPPAKKEPVVNKPPRKPGEYYFDSTTKHYTAIILDKVDPLFVTEVKNAYFRFNREHYRNQVFNINSVDLDATHRIVLIGDFATAREAMNYMQLAKQSAPSEVMPWLKPDKYTFSIITDDNLPLLLEKKDLEQYRKFLVQNLPGKF